MDEDDVLPADNYLFDASRNGYLEVVRFLLYFGRYTDEEKEYALYLATVRDRLPIVELLANNGVSIHWNNDMSLAKAASFGYLDIVEFLVGRGARNIRRALYYALGVLKYNIAEYLIGHGATIDDINYALRKEAVRGNLEVVQFLVQHGANDFEHAIDIATVWRDRALEGGRDEHANYLEDVIEYLESLIPPHWFFETVATQTQPIALAIVSENENDVNPTIDSILIEEIPENAIYVKCSNSTVPHRFMYQTYNDWCNRNRDGCIKCPICRLNMIPQKYINVPPPRVGMTRRFRRYVR